MKKEPHIGKYIDDEEKELVEAIERDDYVFGESNLNPEKLEFFKKAAQNTLNDERQKISLRVPKNDLSRLKAKAMREGIPYQTAINSLIHKYVSK
jgi:predicted DNA binding CopG/RHH family protein